MLGVPCYLILEHKPACKCVPLRMGSSQMRTRSYRAWRSILLQVRCGTKKAKQVTYTTQQDAKSSGYTAEGLVVDL